MFYNSEQLKIPFFTQYYFSVGEMSDSAFKNNFVYTIIFLDFFTVFKK